MAALTPLSPGAKATLAAWGALIVWDLVCPDGQTASQAVARGLADEHTRIPVASVIAMTVTHVVALAIQERKRGL